MATISFSDLERKLLALETTWLKRSKLPLHPQFSKLIRTHDNFQYFVLADAKKANAKLPVVVLVGINYAQAAIRIPNGTTPPQVVDHVVNLATVTENIRAAALDAATRPNAWRASGLAPEFSLCPTLPDDFHLVMTNLSPFITQTRWQSQMCGDSRALGSLLLANPPYPPSHPGWPFAHLPDLKSELDDLPVIWIGHGLEAVGPHWHQLVHFLGLKDWLLVANLFFGPLAMHVNDTGYVRFGPGRGANHKKL